jgi:hypothetical protein
MFKALFMLLKAGDIPSVTLIAVCIVAMLFSHLPLQEKQGSHCNHPAISFLVSLLLPFVHPSCLVPS